jgi:hypothetical protein
MSVLYIFVRAYLELLRIEIYLWRRDFPGLYERVRRYPLRLETSDADAAHKLCEAMDLACIWYWRQALCLQRSAALTCLLKRHGIAAQMVIGAQQIPFRSHAWVEVNGRVVNDKSYVAEVFAVLDRC